MSDKGAPRPRDFHSLDLAVLGTAKGGTTALYHYLDQHPDVVMADPKEPHFFDAYFDGDFRSYIDGFPTEEYEDQVLGEATPHSLFVPYVAGRLHAYAPDAKLVAILRDPVERAYSDWWMYWTRSTEPLSFPEAIDANLTRLRNGPSFFGKEAEELWRQYHTNGQTGTGGEIEYRPYVEIGHYAEQIERYLKHFDRDQFSVFLSSDFREDPERVVRSIWRDLALDVNVEIGEPERRNEAMGGVARQIYTLARTIGAEELLHVLPRKMRTYIKQLTARLDERPPMPTDVRARLSKHYEPHNRRLEKLIDRDLSHWTRP